MMTASSSTDELSCSSLSYNSDAAAVATMATNDNNDAYSDLRKCLKDDESYDAIANSTAATSAAAAVVVEDNGRETDINMDTVVNFDLVPPPPPHIELLHLSTDATVKAAFLFSSDRNRCSPASIHTGGDSSGVTGTSVTCIAHVMSYLDDDSREFARVSCSYLRGAVGQYHRAYIQSLTSAMTSTNADPAVVVGDEGEDRNDNEKEQTSIYPQDLHREQQLQTHQQHHSSSSLECHIDARETIPSSPDGNNDLQLRFQPPNQHQSAPPSPTEQKQRLKQLTHHEITPSPPTYQPTHYFRYAGESLSSSFNTESLDDSTLLSSYPQHTILEEDDEESWELNPIVQNCHRRKDDDSVDIDVRDCMMAATIIERKTNGMDENTMVKDNSTTPDILAQFSDAMLYGDTPPVLSQFMSGIVDSAKLAVSQLYHHQHNGGGIGWRNRIDDDDGVDDAGPIKIGDKYYSHNEALRRWRKAKVKLEDRYHGIDAEGNVTLEQTTYFEKSSLFKDRDAKAEKHTLRNHWDGGGGDEEGEEKDEKFVSDQEEGDGTSMSIDHLVTTYATLKEAKEVGKKDVNIEIDCNIDVTKQGELRGPKRGDFVDGGDTAALSSSSSSSSLDSSPLTAPPPPPPEQHASPPLARANISNATIQQGDKETDCLTEERSAPTDMSIMHSPGIAYKFIGSNAVRKDCEQSVLGSQYGMEVLLKMPKKAVVARKPRTLASHNFGVAKVVARHGPATKHNDFIWTESSDGGGDVAAASTAMTTVKQEVMPPSPLRSHLKKSKSSSWTNRPKSNPQSISKILPLKLKLGMKKSVKP